MYPMSLDEFLDDAYDGDVPASGEPYKIEDDGNADWAFRRVASAQKEIDRVRDQAGDEIDKIEAWRDQRVAAAQSTIDFFTEALKGYRLRLEDEQGDDLPNTYALPYGDLSRRKSPDTMDVTVPAEFLTWATENLPEAVHTEPRVSALKAKGSPFRPERDPKNAKAGDRIGFVDADGNPVPGVVLVVGERKVKVTAR